MGVRRRLEGIPKAKVGKAGSPRGAEKQAGRVGVRLRQEEAPKVKEGVGVLISSTRGNLLESGLCTASVVFKDNTVL